jgi:UDP-glucose 4-epimerase
MSIALVTGGAGFIGSHLVERLLEQGRDVRVVDNFSTGRRANIEHLLEKIDLREADIRDLDAMREAMKDIDVVFHEAALASVPRSVDDPVTSNEVNVVGTLNVLMAARDAGVRRVVYASSSSVYGEAPELPKTEVMRPLPMSPYAVGKLAGEHYCVSFNGLYDIETVCLRYFNVFGPRQDPTSQYAAAVPIFTSALLRGDLPTIYGDGEQSRDFTYVSSVVEANVLAGESKRAPGGVFNVARGDTVTVNELFASLTRLIGVDIEATFADARPGDIKHSYADITQAREVLGYVPLLGFEDGLRLTISWFREHSADA